MGSEAREGKAAGTGVPAGEPARDDARAEPAAKPDGRQARWARHNERRRQQIIDAAVEATAARPPGAEVHVQDIAERAGVNRTVVYRYFADRADLDLAIQQAIVGQLWHELLPAVTLEGTVPQIIERIVGTYVDWAVSHPSLHHVVDHDYGSGALEQALDEIAGKIGEVVTFALASFGGSLDFDEAELDPLMHGLVGAVFGSVRRWLNRTDPVLTPERLRATLSASVWYVIEGHARSAGIVLDPDSTVAELLEAAAGAEERAATVAP